MEGMRVAKYFICNPVVYSDRIHNILPICLKAYVKSLPPCCKFDFPSKLALALCCVRLALVATALDFLLAYPPASVYVRKFSCICQQLLCYCCIEPPATAAHSKIRQYFGIFVLA